MTCDYQNYFVTHLFDIITAVAAITAITFSLVFYRRERKEYYRRKNMDTFINLESNRDTFIGSLKALGIEEALLKKGKFSVEQLMYYAGLLNTMWVRNHYADKRFKKIERVLKKSDYDAAYKKAKEFNEEKPIISQEGQTELILRTDDFKRAWKYLENYWSKKSIARVIVNVTLDSFQGKTNPVYK